MFCRLRLLRRELLVLSPSLLMRSLVLDIPLLNSRGLTMLPPSQLLVSRVRRVGISPKLMDLRECRSHSGRVL